MSRNLLSGMVVLGLMACTSGLAKENEAADKAAVSNGAPRPAATTPAERTLASGTRIGATIRDSLSSRNNKAGESLSATVSGDVKDGNGHVVIPAGSSVQLMVGQLEHNVPHEALKYAS